jgi:hypothetical protein
MPVAFTALAAIRKAASIVDVQDTMLNSVGIDTRPLVIGDVMTRQVITLRPHHSFANSVSLMAH